MQEEGLENNIEDCENNNQIIGLHNELGDDFNYEGVINLQFEN